MYQLQREQVLSSQREDVWNFLANPLNLNILTPPDLRFEILSRLPQRMYNGLLIDYAIHIPLFGQRRWLTEIKHIEEGFRFVDEQRCGPYRFWYHEHTVETLADGRTRMVDLVTYQLPFGPVGRLVHFYLVEKMLADIFAYRSRKLTEIFL